MSPKGTTSEGPRTKSFREDGASALDELIFRLRARRILSEFPESTETVVDLGSGHDYRLLRLLRRTDRVAKGIAVDISLDSPATADSTITLLETDLNLPLDIPERSVDVVLSLAVIEHLSSPGVHLAEAYRMLRTPGWLLLTSPSPMSRPLLEFMAYRLHVIDADEIRDHKHYFNESEIRALLTGAGFDASNTSYRTFLGGLNQFVVARKD